MRFVLNFLLERQPQIRGGGMTEVRIALAAFASVFVLAGCGGKAMLIDRDGKESVGTFDALSQTIEVTINGTPYKGRYVTNSSSSFGSYQTLGAKPKFGTVQTVSGGNQGRAILRSASGDAIQCEFSYQDLTAIGTCVDGRGTSWQFLTE